MEQILTEEKVEKRIFIEKFVNKLYTTFRYLFTEPVEVIKQKAIDKYLDSNMSMADITEDMSNTIEALEREYRRQEKEKNMAVQAEEQPRAIVEPIIDNTTSNYEEQHKAVVEPIVSAAEPIVNTEQVVNNELSAMISDIPQKEVVNTNNDNLVKPKQFVKTDATINQQAGSVSLFNIVLAILCVSTVILVAMILNVLLK